MGLVLLFGVGMAGWGPREPGPPSLAASGPLKLATDLLVPAAQFYRVIKEASAPDGAVAGAVMISLACLVAVGLAFWLCRRYALPVKRTITWTALTALIGPIALAVMWLFLDWPARERCAGCDKARVATRYRCEHCGAVRAGPKMDGTEVFATG